MLPPIALYRRLEGDYVRSGRMVLQVGANCYDLTEILWKGEDPMFISALAARGFFTPDRFEVWMEENPAPRARPIAPDDVLLPPMLPTEVGKILAFGKNFRAHAEEFSEEVPEEPLFFNKLAETLTGHNRLVKPPVGYEGRLDHEVELAVIIGRHADRIDPSSALEYVAGYSVANDLTLRTTQGSDREKRWPWFRSKNFNGACPLGPCFVPEASLNTDALSITARVNGEVRQDANTRDFLVSIPEAIAATSAHIPLHPGDILLMGTPAGVGPLADGDVVECEIQGIGTLRSRVGR